MAVRVRMFAALREAAGTDKCDAPPGPLPQVLDELRGRFGPLFAARLALVSILLDGDPVRPDEEVAVADGAELALLPPVSGGAAAAPYTERPMAKALTSGGLALPALLALVAGPGPFAVVLTLLAGLALIDLTGVLSRAAARPILPAALVPAVGLPVTVALRPDVGWDLVPPFVAGGFLTTFVFALLFGRRRGIVQGAGTTVLAGLVVGLGAASLVLLRALPGGFRWVLAFCLIAAAADLAGPVVAAVRGRGAHARDDHGLAAPVIAAVVTAGILTLVLRPTLALPVSGLLTLIALTAALGGADLQRSLVAEAEADVDVDVEPPPERARLGDGVVFGVLDAIMVGAPIAYILARSVVL